MKRASLGVSITGLALWGLMLTARADAPAGRYTLSGGVVTDTATGLNWQQGSSPNGLPWSTAHTYCSSLPLPGTGWRLPTMKELQTIVDETVVPGGSTATIDLTFFPGTTRGDYWSSSPYAGSTTAAWFVAFDLGNSAYYGDTSNPNYVRCVR